MPAPSFQRPMLTLRGGGKGEEGRWMPELGSFQRKVPLGEGSGNSEEALARARRERFEKEAKKVPALPYRDPALINANWGKGVDKSDPAPKMRAFIRRKRETGEEAMARRLEEEYRKRYGEEAEAADRREAEAAEQADGFFDYEGAEEGVVMRGALTRAPSPQPIIIGLIKDFKPEERDWHLCSKKKEEGAHVFLQMASAPESEEPKNSSS